MQFVERTLCFLFEWLIFSKLIVYIIEINTARFSGVTERKKTAWRTGPGQIAQTGFFLWRGKS